VTTHASDTIVAAQAVHVGKVYGSGATAVTALDGVSADFPAGEFTAIMGPSGSGKSTLMHCLAGLDTVTSGEVYIGGEPLSRMSDKRLTQLRRDRVGFVFQQFNLLPRTTALKQVMLPLSYARPRPADPDLKARRRLEQVGLGDRLCHHPQQLSGGQQQRVAIARALVNGPKLLLADEPTGALDSKTSADVMELFRDLNGKGITIVVVTHEAEVARYARRRIVFGDGVIVEDARLPS
jgi:putative ABC transport system ATP-binding protein